MSFRLARRKLRPLEWIQKCWMHFYCFLVKEITKWAEICTGWFYYISLDWCKVWKNLQTLYQCCIMALSLLPDCSFTFICFKGIQQVSEGPFVITTQNVSPAHKMSPRVRNRWFLALTLSRNPALILTRKRSIKEFQVVGAEFLDMGHDNLME